MYRCAALLPFYFFGRYNGAQRYVNSRSFCIDVTVRSVTSICSYLLDVFSDRCNGVQPYANCNLFFDQCNGAQRYVTFMSVLINVTAHNVTPILCHCLIDVTVRGVTSMLINLLIDVTVRIATSI